MRTSNYATNMNFPFKLLPSAAFDVVGFGTNALDHLIRVAAYPESDSKVELIEYATQSGGEAASTIVALQRLGLRTVYVGRFGEDEGGEAGRCSLIDEGVDVSFSQIVKGASTQVGFIVIDDRTGERTVLWHRDKKLAYQASDVPLSAVTLGKVLHLTPHDVQASLAMARRARESGVIVSMDIDNVFDGVDELLSLIDILITSSDIPESLTGLTDNKEALREMRLRFGCGVIGLTLGRSGSAFYCEGSFIQTDGFVVPGGCKDTTGAGDAFRAGFLYGFLSGETVEVSARLANGVAALKCRRSGARSGLPNEDELTKFVGRI